MSVTFYILLIAITILGGALAWLIKINNRKSTLTILLSFSGAYLLGINLTHILPIIYENDESHVLGVFVLLGFVIQLFLDQLSKGIEHGHLHYQVGGKNKFLSLAPIIIGLSLHAFMEGLPLGYSDELDHVHHHHHDHSGQHIFWGILLHKVPAAFVLVILLREVYEKALYPILFLLFFALMSPLGAFLSQTIDFSWTWASRLLAIVGGSLLHVSTVILFEMDNSNEHKISLLKLIFIFIGFGLSLLSIL